MILVTGDVVLDHNIYTGTRADAGLDMRLPGVCVPWWQLPYLARD
jgi:hypothetical protein